MTSPVVRFEAPPASPCSAMYRDRAPSLCFEPFATAATFVIAHWDAVDIGLDGRFLSVLVVPADPPWEAPTVYVQESGDGPRRAVEALEAIERIGELDTVAVWRGDEWRIVHDYLRRVVGALPTADTGGRS